MSGLKVRIGFSAGVGAGADPGAAGPGFGHLVDELERLGFDSIWVPEVLTADSLDPLTALGFAAGRTRRLKLGSHLVVPGRNPARLAKELATLDQLSGGRLLLTFVLGLAEGPELSAQGVERADRAAQLDETLAVLRRLWAGETVTHHGRFVRLDQVAVHPRPCQQPLEVWFGGLVPSALRRCGELADGWIPGLIGPARAAAAKAAIDQAAAAVGRRIDPEHFGANVAYAQRRLADEARARLAARNPQEDPASLVPVGGAALRERLEELVAVGFSKFVLRPMVPPPGGSPTAWTEELERLADAVLGLQAGSRPAPLGD